jgi:hypothetical protein
VTFASGATSITLPSPEPPTAIEGEVPQAGIQTGDGWYAYKLGVEFYVATLVFPKLTSSEFNDLYSFFEDTVKGGTTEFTYTDAAGTGHTVRFVAPLSYEKRAADSYSAEVQVRSEDVLK